MEKDFEYEEATKCQQLPFNPQETARIEKLPVYVHFKAWLKQNGVLVDPRVRYPCYFGQKDKGIVGIGVSKAIERKRGIIAVPYSLCITVNQVMNSPQLRPIIQDNSVMFLRGADSASKILTLFVSLELLKGKDSFYAPYFEVEENSFLTRWNKKSKDLLQNKEISASIREQLDKIEKLFMDFLRIYRHYDKIFPDRMSNEEYQNLFERAYNFIATRAYGWSVPSISLIPLADSLNHSNVNYLNHFVTNIDREKELHKKQQENYRDNINLSLLQDQFFMLNQERLAELREGRKSRVLQFVEKHKNILVASKKIKDEKAPLPKKKSDLREKQFHILHQQYKAGIHKLRNLHFYESSCSEDNDTDQDELFESTVQLEKFELQDRSRGIKEAEKVREVKKYWKFFYDEQQDSSEQDSDEEESDAPVKASKNKESQLQVLKQKEEDDKEQSSSAQSSQSDDPDEQFEWFYEKQVDAKKSYFIMNTKEVVRQNQQIYNFYGRRSNKFLLLGYNFIVPDNTYDSYPLRIKLDPKITSKVAASKLFEKVSRRSNPLRSKNLKLKKYRVSSQLVNLCRSYVLLWTKKEWKNCSVCVPFDRQVEQKTLELYQQIVKSSLKSYQTSVESDDELLEQQIKNEERTAILLRRQHKKILKGQDQMVGKCLTWLKKWKAGQVYPFEQGEMKWVKRAKGYLVQLQRAVTL